MAGAETPLATGQPDLSTITTGAPPQVPLAPNPAMQQAPMQGNPFQVQAPINFNIQGQQRATMDVVPGQYAGQLSQADLGQQQVQQYGFREGNVPVAQMGLPHGATAARQQALAERTQQNKLAQQKLLEKWDPMGGVGKAADPFQPAFAQATTQDFNRLVDDWAQVLGDKSEAYKFLSGQMPGRELEGKQVTQAWSQNWDAIAQANRGYFKRAVDAVAGVDELKAYLSPEDQKVLRGFLTASTPEGLPIPGTDPQDYMLQGRRIEGILSKAQFIKNFAKDIPNIVQSEAQKLGKVIPLPGGNYALEDISEKDMEEAVKLYARQYADIAEMAGIDASAFEQELRLLFNDERKRQLKIFKREKPGKGSGDGDSDTPFVGGVERGLNKNFQKVIGVNRFPLGQNIFTPETGASEVEYRKVYDRTGGKNVDMGPRTFRDSDGNPITLKPQYIIADKNGDLFVSGIIPSESESVTYISEEIDPATNRPVKREVTSTKESPVIILPLRGQEATATTFFGEGWDQGFGGASGESIEDLLKKYGQ
jgi:hypothetical protein